MRYAAGEVDDPRKKNVDSGRVAILYASDSSDAFQVLIRFPSSPSTTPKPKFSLHCTPPPPRTPLGLPLHTRLVARLRHAWGEPALTEPPSRR
jgi:hypothetical protein